MKSQQGDTAGRRHIVERSPRRCRLASVCVTLAAIVAVMMASPVGAACPPPLPAPAFDGPSWMATDGTIVGVVESVRPEGIGATLRVEEVWYGTFREREMSIVSGVGSRMERDVQYLDWVVGQRYIVSYWDREGGQPGPFGGRFETGGCGPLVWPWRDEYASIRPTSAVFLPALEDRGADGWHAHIGFVVGVAVSLAVAVAAGIVVVTRRSRRAT